MHPKGPAPQSLDDVDPEIRATFDKLGISLAEQERLSGIAVDAIMDSVSVATTFKAKLAEAGVVFCSFSEAVREHPDVVRRYLERDGLEVSIAHDGSEALRLLGTERIDVAVLDVMMPGPDGLTLCRSLRQRGDYTVPVILLTALGAEDGFAFAEDQLDQRRVLAQPRRQLPRLGARLDVDQAAHPALALRDRLLGDDEHVRILEAADALGRGQQERREIVVLLDLRDALERDDPDFSGHGRPEMRRPA